MSQDYIELNGKRYDATTGALLGVSKTPLQALPKIKTQPKVIDGFIRPGSKLPAPQQPVHRRPKIAPSLSQATAKPPTQKVPTATLHHAGHTHVHSVAKSLDRHHPEHAKTLMRHTVKKPHVHIKPAIKTQVAVELPAKLSKHTIAHKLAATNVNLDRLERAKTVVRHGGIQHFGGATNSSVTFQEANATSHHHVPVIPVRPHPVRPAVHTERRDMFETAMRHAKSHEQPVHKARHPRHRMANTVAIIAIFFVMVGFIAYINMPGIEIHIASFDAGFSAHLPGYSPTGYAMEGGVRHSGSTVSMRFVSGDSSYTITEQPSNWTPETLASNTAALTGAKPVERSGKLIYIYNGSNAAWVSNNIRYDITGDASISTNDLANIAASM